MEGWLLVAQLFRQCHCHPVLKTTKPKHRRCGRCGCLEISGCISLTRLPLISWPICHGLCPKKERKIKKNKKQQRPPNIDQQIRQSRGVACAAKEMGAMRMVFFLYLRLCIHFDVQCNVVQVRVGAVMRIAAIVVDRALGIEDCGLWPGDRGIAQVQRLVPKR